MASNITWVININFTTKINNVKLFCYQYNSTEHVMGRLSLL